MPNKSLQKKITKKLEKLHQLLDKFDEVRTIEPTDPETWDADTLYNLVEDLKEALELLQDQKNARQSDPYGEPITWASGLCSLVDEYHPEEEAND